MADEEIVADCQRNFGPDIGVHARFRISGEVGRSTALFGPSGCGKSTSLRLLAGLERPDRGVIRGGGEVWSDVAAKVHVPVWGRQVGLLAQDPALFPHLSVAENVGYGLRLFEAIERRRRVSEMLDLVGLSGLGQARPTQLSGGQAQRVALARALVRLPRWMLLDEPFSALDEALRVDLRRDLRNLLRARGQACVWVTHDRGELETLADDLVLMLDGRVLQVGPVSEVLAGPISCEAAGALGFENIHALEKLGPGAWQEGARGDAKYLAFRAENAVLRERNTGGERLDFAFSGFVQSVQGEGAVMRVKVASASVMLEAVLSRQYFDAGWVRVGQELELGVAVECCRFLH